MIKKYMFCLMISFVFVLSINAQDKDKAILLKLVFEKIEKKHQITLNYIEDEIAIFKIIPPNENLELAQKLDYISKKTKLEFKYISSTYISVINNKNLDKPLCGFLLDNETQLPIEQATIHISDTEYSTKTNENGYFELQIKSPNSIVVTHVNYEKKILKPEDLYKENCPTIVLKSIVYELTEVVAEVFLTKGVAKKTDGTFEIKPKKFGLLPGLTEPDVFQTIQQLPGITSVDETISNINVRGGTHDQNLFLFNGIRLFQTGHFFGLISALNPNLAHKIKVSKNGSSPFYGESVSSIIDISTHSENIENSSTSFGVNMINADLYTKIKTSKNSNLEISARRSFTDLLQSPTYKSYYNRIFQNTVVTNLANNQNIDYKNEEDFYFYDFTLQFHQKIGSKTNLYFDAISISNSLNLDESKLENSTTIQKNSFLEQESLGGNIIVNQNWNSNNSTEAIIYASKYSVSSENEAILSNQIFNQENTVLDTGIKIKNTHQLTKKIQFNNGYQFNEIGIRNVDQINSPTFFRNIKTVLLTHALIFELQYKSENNKLKTTIGTRNNYIEQFKKYIFEPRLQFNYAIKPSLNLEILAEQKHQTSSQIIDLQQDFLGIEKRRWILSNNETIPIIKNSQASIGLTYKKKNWLVTLDNFYKKVAGITSFSQSFQNQLEFEKIIGNYSVFGSEILIQKQFSRFTSWISYTFTKNDYQFDTYLPPIFSNNFELKHNISMATIYDYKKLKVALGTKWFTGKPTTLPASNSAVFTTPNNPEIIYNSPNSSNLEDYFQLNFSTSYGVKVSKKAELLFGLSIQNILDSKNSINQYFRINQNTNTIEKVNTISLERTPNAFLRFNF